MKYCDVLNDGYDRLNEAQVAEAKSDAFILFEYIFKMDRTKYIMDSYMDAPDNLTWCYFEAIDKRCNNIPVQYITGVQEFMGYEFLVNEHTLIPRMDTEVLVYEAKKFIDILKKDRDSLKVLDMCTGTGCIGISLGLMYEDIDVTVVDVSKGTLKVTNANIDKLGAKNVKAIESNLFENIKDKYDIIISNPPYIKSSVIEDLDEEVKSHEPRLALDGYEDGLYFYREITKEAKKHLKDASALLYEIGYDQGKEVSDIMLTNEYSDVSVIKDLSGLDRVVTGWLNH